MKNLIIAIICGIVLIVVIAFGIKWFMGKDDSKPEKSKTGASATEEKKGAAESEKGAAAAKPAPEGSS